MTVNKILGVTVKPSGKEIILEKIQKYMSHPEGMMHIVSLNPEIMIIGQQNKAFQAILNSAQVTLADGIGLYTAGKLLNIPVGDRLTGTDTMGYLLDYCGRERFSVLFIGGKPKVADDLAKCYSQKYPKAAFIGIQGVTDILALPNQDEEQYIADIVSDRKPRFVFTSFGSPYQEIWLQKHAQLFAGCICMGVGGGFDFLGARVPRAPQLLRNIGLEWLFRLFKEPWRWRRQLRLIEFIWLVFLQKLGFLRFD